MADSKLILIFTMIGIVLVSSLLIFIPQTVDPVKANLDGAFLFKLEEEKGGIQIPPGPMIGVVDDNVVKTILSGDNYTVDIDISLICSFGLIKVSRDTPWILVYDHDVVSKKLGITVLFNYVENGIVKSGLFHKTFKFDYMSKNASVSFTQKDLEISPVKNTTISLAVGGSAEFDFHIQYQFSYRTDVPYWKV